MKTKTLLIVCFLCLVNLTIKAQDISMQEGILSVNGTPIDKRWHIKSFKKVLGKPKKIAEIDIYASKGIELFINPEDSEVESIRISYNYKMDNIKTYFTNDFAGKLTVQGVEINGNMTMENFITALPQYAFHTDDKGATYGLYKNHYIYLDYNSSNNSLVDVEILYLEEEDLKK